MSKKGKVKHYDVVLSKQSHISARTKQSALRQAKARVRVRKS